MSIASELNRLLQAKSDLATSITNKGVTVPAATTIDGYAALVDQIQQGTPLPYDAEIEYLESTGTQYINTGLIATYDSKFGAEVTYTLNTSGRHSNGTGYICGSGGAFDGFSIRMQGAGYNHIRFGATYGAAYIFAERTVTSTSVIYQSNKNGVAVLSVDGTNLIGTISKSNTGFLSAPVILFGENRSTGAFTAALVGAKIYSAIFFHDYNVIMDLIPVRVGQVGYMYDRVSKTLFGNNGTGSFTLGPDVT